MKIICEWFGLKVIAHKLQCAAPVVKIQYQHTDNNNALFCAVNVSNVFLHFVDAFDKLTDKIIPSVNNVCISYSLLYVRYVHNNIPNDCQNVAKSLYINILIGHRVGLGTVYLLHLPDDVVVIDVININLQIKNKKNMFFSLLYKNIKKHG